MFVRVVVVMQLKVVGQQGPSGLMHACMHVSPTIYHPVPRPITYLGFWPVRHEAVDDIQTCL